MSLAATALTNTAITLATMMILTGQNHCRIVEELSVYAQEGLIATFTPFSILKMFSMGLCPYCLSYHGEYGLLVES